MSMDAFAAVYLVASVFFILGLKGLSSPATARRGNGYAIAGMALAIGATLFDPSMRWQYMPWVFAGLAIGAAIGIPLARRIQMTAMPELVALLHSFVGLAAVLVGFGMYMREVATGEAVPLISRIEVFVGVFIGAITFSGSLIAFGKLSGTLRSAPIVFRGQHALNLLLAIVMILSGIAFAATENLLWLDAMTAIAFILGITLIIPIGGADMPVIVSMLNSYSGWAAVATGFTLNNNLMIVTGALVGSSGAILSYIMCKAMNRSFVSVILGGFGTDEQSAATAGAADRHHKEASVEDAVYMLGNAARVIIVPGYGMAVAQAQHAVRELTDALIDKGVDVRFAIHPVAGRMPGHMNVLLAEADIPYDIVFELEDINSDFSDADAALVIGANDVVNPAAKSDRSSPIYGMPILEAYRARQVYCIKRSMRSGYAGVENELYFADNCMMVFGDAKKVVEKMVSALKE